MFNIFRDTIAKDLTKIADYFNGVADAGTIFKDKRALAVNRIKNAVLNGDIGGGGGVTPEIEAEIENAQWKSETSTPLFNETVTTVEPAEGIGFAGATLEYGELIDADTLIVTFEGTEYVCQKRVMGDSFAYGASPDDYSVYPFAIASGVDGDVVVNQIVTHLPGEYTVSVASSATTYTDTFKEGVHQNVLKEVESEDEADIIVLSLASGTVPSVTKNCLKLSTSGNPTSYTEAETFGADIIVLYKAVDSEFRDGVYSYFQNALTKIARCYYGSSVAEPTVMAFRVESDATLENVSDYYTIRFFSYGLGAVIGGGESGGGGGVS